MSDRFLAFRCFGDYAWPPVRSKTTVKTTAKGVVEVHYVVASPQNLVGCLRWVPKSKWTANRAFDTALDDITYLQGSAKTLAEAQTALLNTFANAAETIVELRFDVPLGKSYLGVVLPFEGMQLFEQYAVSKDGAGQFSQKLDLRIPVLKDYFEDNNNLLSSRVVIGQDETNSLRMDLAIPLASPLDEEQYQARRTFLGFSASYPAVIAIKKFSAASQGLAVGELVFGRQNRSTANLNFGALKAPFANVLGKFVFAKYLLPTSVNRDACVETKETQDYRWWPTGESIIKQLFPSLGVRTSGISPNTSVDVEHGDISDNKDFDDTLFPAPSVAIKATCENDRPGFRLVQRFMLSAVGTKDPVSDPNADLRIKSGIFELRVPGMAASWIKFGKSIHITLTLSGAISDGEVWAEDHALIVDASITSAMNFGYGAFTRDSTNLAMPDPSVTGLSFFSLLAASVSAMDRARLALHQLAPDQPQSALPKLVAPQQSEDGFKHFGVFCQFDGLYSVGKPLSIKPTDWSLMFTDPKNTDVFNDTTKAQKDTRINVTATWPSLHRVPQPILCCLTSDTLNDEKRNLSGMRFGLRPMGGAANKATLTALLGGLEFDQDPGQFLNEGWIRVCVRTDAGVRNTTALLGIELNVTFNVSSVEPIAVDVVRGDRTGRAQSLIYREPDTGTGIGKYLLKCLEAIRTDQQWQLTASLLENVQSNKGVTASLLIGQEPFSIQRFYSMPLDMLGGEDNSIIANYDSDEGAWKFKLTSPLYHYVLPPQSVGESMDKPRRLELQDVDDSKELGDLGFIRPTSEQKPESPGLCRRAVEFRLTPPAHLWVQPNDVERNYSFPEWASDTIFSQHSELGLGCALTSLQGEFIYGLSFGITSKLEKGSARRTRVAEIEALIGRPVPRDDRAAGADPTRWNLLHKAMQTRPQRLELWADDPSQDVQFAPVRFSDGARFALRTTALHRPAVTSLDTPVDPLEGPKTPTQKVTDLSPRLHPFGLSGGALWPIESANVLNLILNQPQASGGSIEKIALSPLGGDADQTVKFNNNRVAIVSETRGGFVQRQKVEVIGRISVFWHRAKHVVVYERTVNPSAQFTPMEGLETRTRRPVLRKISEYIEILEPERRYPDMPNVAASTSSFLKAMRFNKRIIAVDSLWAEEVDSTGWIVPLWNRHAARQRPQVYTMPDIAFVTASEGEGDNPQAAQECLNPENLYFFADTSPDQTDNTDAWAIRNGIDYINLPPPQFFPPPALATNIPAGFSRFTWRLAPASQRTTINAGRADKPVYAGLETLTFMRAGKHDESNDQVTLKQNVIDNIAGVVQRASTDDVRVFNGYWGKGDQVQGPLADLSTSLANAVASLPTTMPTDDGQKAAIRACFEALKLSVSIGHDDNNELLSRLGKILTHCQTEFGAINAGLDLLSSAKSCEQLTANLSSAIGAKRLAIVQEVQSWREEWIRLLPETLPTHFSARPAFDLYLMEQLNQLLRPVFESASAELGKLRRGIETARLTATEVVGAVHGCLDRAKTDLDTVKRSIDQQKPWSQARREQSEKNLQVAFDQANAAINREVGSAKQRLAVELDDLSQRVGVVTASAIEATLQGEGQLRQILESELSLVGRLETLKRALTHDGNVGALTDSLDASIKAILAIHPDLSQALAPFQAYLKKTKDLLSDESKPPYSQWVNVLQSVENQLSDDVHQATKALTAALQTLATDTDTLRGKLQTDLAAVDKHLLQALDSSMRALPVILTAETKQFLAAISTLDQWFECQFMLAGAQLDAADQWLVTNSHSIDDRLNDAAHTVLKKVEKIEESLESKKFVETLVSNLFQLPAFTLVIERLGPAVFNTTAEVDDRIAAAKLLLNGCTNELVNSLDNASELLGGLTSKIQDACALVSSDINSVRVELTKTAAAALEPLKARLAAYEEEIFKKVDDALVDLSKYKTLLNNVEAFDRDIRELGNNLALSRDLLEGYGERVVDAVGHLGDGGLMAMPNNILRAMAAFGSTPQLPNLDFSALCSPYFFGRVEDCVDMAPISAWFGRMGDDLKALGLDLPIDKISDRLLPVDLSTLDIGKVLKNVGGVDLGSLLGGYKLPSAATDAIRVTHEFDKKNMRAWVQVDVDLPLPERRSLFSIGPFTLDVINARVTAVVRLEASKDSAQVEQSGTATLLTDFDAVVGGQSMVTLNQVAVRYDKNSGLNVDFDPKKIKLNPGFEFIQNTFQSIFGDDIGGLKLIKDNGIPVGIEHLFSLPPMGMMFGTSGVQNIQISNAFRLLAFPDFLISNSFALARSDLPFVFSVFIIGGSGWLTIDVNYRPFKNELAVVVDAAAGGSASLGFSFCGVSGTVSISLNVALTYRKLIGKPGGGLTVSMVVVIVGVVDVLRIATAQIGVTLRLSYKENGDIDATGTFRVTIKISRFFSVSAGGQVHYSMVGGQEKTKTETHGDVRSDSYDKAKKLLNGQGR